MTNESSIICTMKEKKRNTVHKMINLIEIVEII